MKIGFLFSAIHLPPVEEGEFLLTFVKMSFRNISLKGIFIYFSNLFYDILILLK